MSDHHTNCKICKEQEERSRRLAVEGILTTDVREEIRKMIREEMETQGEDKNEQTHWIRYF